MGDLSSTLCSFFFKQKTAYVVRISDWSSDVCSSDLLGIAPTAILGRVAVIAVEAQRHQRDAQSGGEHDAEDQRDQAVAAHTKIAEAGYRPEDQEGRAHQDDARCDKADNPADLVAVGGRACCQAERRRCGAARSGEADEGRDAMGGCYHGRSPLPLMSGRRPGRAYWSSTSSTDRKSAV